MRIAVLASNFIRLPPTPEYIPAGFSGAPELIAWWITEELVRRGHTVTLFASGDSKTRAELRSVTEIPVSQMGNPNVEFALDYEYMLASYAYSLAKENQFDIIHSHLTSRSAFYASFVKTPTVVTIHSPLNGQGGRVLRHFKKNQYYVSISCVQREPIPDLNFVETINHGIDLSEVPFSEKKGEYLVFIGRFVAQKGMLAAVQTARELGEDLILFGTAATDSSYFESEVRPLIDHVKIQTMGFLERPKLFDVLRGAKALLFPISWEEPFGLVMIEAMACGTPVVAYARGSVPEVVVDGVTGFIVAPEGVSHLSNLSHLSIKKKGIEGLVEAVKRINFMSEEEYRQMRLACRKHVEEKFTVERMVDGYERVYKKVLAHSLKSPK